MLRQNKRLNKIIKSGQAETYWDDDVLEGEQFHGKRLSTTTERNLEQWFQALVYLLPSILGGNGEPFVVKLFPFEDAVVPVGFGLAGLDNFVQSLVLARHGGGASGAEESEVGREVEEEETWMQCRFSPSQKFFTIARYNQHGTSARNSQRLWSAKE
ncbi:hypothetical protein B9479_006759 [Cryptococcus floricola]|uniref:Uncharacterized protein n=1 Tax=Cryptococcus floricola TaxID=2591691 RepID=A0A5D3AM75_9TREE|nr:hypothetical protein B9479_006759 [Cryptococcus floricola]